MKAIVKDIPVNTMAKDEEDEFLFMEAMKKYVGKTISLKPWHSFAVPMLPCENWFQDVKTGYVYHRSWLEIMEKRYIVGPIQSVRAYDENGEEIVEWRYDEGDGKPPRYTSNVYGE